MGERRGKAETLRPSVNSVWLVHEWEQYDGRGAWTRHGAVLTVQRARNSGCDVSPRLGGHSAQTSARSNGCKQLLPQTSYYQI